MLHSIRPTTSMCRSSHLRAHAATEPLARTQRTFKDENINKLELCLIVIHDQTYETSEERQMALPRSSLYLKAEE